MKHKIVTMCLLATFTLMLQTTFAQRQKGKTPLSYELRSPLANFKEADVRFELEEDTIFFISRGFRILPGTDVSIEGGKTYVIVRYPVISGPGRQAISKATHELAEPQKPVHFPLMELPGSMRNGRYLAIEKSEFDKLEFDTLYSRKGGEFTSGQLTIPFKLRAKQGDTNFQITTDVTLGAYAGWRWRISRRQPFFLTVPLNLGLTFININENTTSPTSSETSGLVPGWSFASGLILEYNKVNAGFVIGRDYASGIGKDWIYQNKTWTSFAIGYSFMR